MSIGAATAYVPVSWLNATRKSSGNLRIIRLLNTANKLESLTHSKQLPSLHLLTWRPSGTKKQMVNLKKTRRLAHSLRTQLSRYEVSPEISPVRRDGWHLRWKPVTKTAQVPITLSMRGDTETYLFGEEDVVLRILELSKQGNLRRIQECEYSTCRKWFYARVRHQHYCSFKCQQAHFSKSPESKNKRKLYMRVYRKRERDRNRRADLAARVKSL